VKAAAAGVVLVGASLLAATAQGRQSLAASCRISQLRVALGPDLTAPTGQHPLALRLVNRGGAACVLDGYPVIELLDERGRIPFTSRHDGNLTLTSKRPKRVIVRPGGRAFVALSKYRCDLGDIRLARELRVHLPGGRPRRWAALGIPRASDIAFCGKGDPGSLVSVSPFEPTLRAVLRR
jgi:hypothetical protein